MKNRRIKGARLGAYQIKKRAGKYPNSLRYYRERNGLTRNEVAAHVNVSLTTMLRAERNNSLMLGEKWQQLAELFNITFEELRKPITL